LKNLTLNLEEEVAVLNKYRITPNELMLVKTLLLLQDEENEDLFKTYIEVLYNCGVKLRDGLLSLQEKGIILKSYKVPKEGEAFDPYSIPFNKSFIKTLYKCSFELGKELFTEYPQFGSVQGNVVGLRSISKKFDSLEDAYFKYGRSIGWNPERHNHIIELVKWAREHNIINYTLASFIVDHRWLELEALKDGEGNINYESIKML
jgi:hypothetical protein